MDSDPPLSRASRRDFIIAFIAPQQDTVAWVVVAVRLLPLGGVECATCVPFGDVEWHEIS